jgi:hypothetical protein
MLMPVGSRLNWQAPQAHAPLLADQGAFERARTVVLAAMRTTRLVSLGPRTSWRMELSDGNTASSHDRLPISLAGLLDETIHVVKE